MVTLLPTCPSINCDEYLRRKFDLQDVWLLGSVGRAQRWIQRFIKLPLGESSIFSNDHNPLLYRSFFTPFSPHENVGITLLQCLACSTPTTKVKSNAFLFEHHSQDSIFNRSMRIVTISHGLDYFTFFLSRFQKLATC